MPTKPAAKASAKDAKPQNPLQKPLQVSAELDAVVGAAPLFDGRAAEQGWAPNQVAQPAEPCRPAFFIP